MISRRIAVEYAENMLSARKSPKYLTESYCLNCALNEDTELISLFSTKSEKHESRDCSQMHPE